MYNFAVNKCQGLLGSSIVLMLSIFISSSHFIFLCEPLITCSASILFCFVQIHESCYQNSIFFSAISYLALCLAPGKLVNDANSEFLILRDFCNPILLLIPHIL